MSQKDPQSCIFSPLFQLSSATRAQGQGLASAWALAPRAVTASSQRPWTSKPKAAVAASSRIPCLRAQAAAVQPGRLRGEGLAVTLGSVSRKPQGPDVPPAPALSRPGGASSVAAIPVPSPSPVVLHAVHAVRWEIPWGVLPVTSPLAVFHWVTAPNTEITPLCGCLSAASVNPFVPMPFCGRCSPGALFVLCFGSCPVLCFSCNKQSEPLDSQCQICCPGCQHPQRPSAFSPSDSCLPLGLWVDTSLHRPVLAQ